jgi:hypothetical protein
VVRSKSVHIGKRTKSPQLSVLVFRDTYNELMRLKRRVGRGVSLGFVTRMALEKGLTQYRVELELAAKKKEGA